MAVLKNNICDVLKDIVSSDIEDHLYEKVLYLIEWKYILIHGERLFDLNWEHTPFGISAKYNEEANITYSISYSIRKRLIVKFIFEKINRLKYTELMNLVMSTYPLIKTETYDSIDLIELALDYKDSLSEKDLKYIQNVRIKKLNMFEKIKEWFNGKLWGFRRSFRRSRTT